MKIDLELFDNKIIMLYILDKANTSLTIEQIAKFCIEFEDISYFDICDYITSLTNSGLVYEKNENNLILYNITNEGKNTLHELLELVPGISIHNLKKLIEKEMAKIKREDIVEVQTTPIGLNEYQVSCYIKEGNDQLINISLYSGNKEQTENITRNWKENANEIYNAVLKMLTKNNENN